MRFWWSDRTEHTARRDRAASASRPRVARAVAAAQRVYAEPVGLGSAVADMGALRHFFAVERAAEVSGPLRRQQARREQRGLEPELLRETARVARTSGRTPEQIWAEALRGWLAAYNDEAAQPCAALETRRQTVWREIDATLAGLRAS
jgi:hypothetical protein